MVFSGSGSMAGAGSGVLAIAASTFAARALKSSAPPRAIIAA
jgi:hypothetical protein